MKINHLFIYGDNINSLCDFYSFVFDCEIHLTEKDPFLHFDHHKFIFKKVLGKRVSILPSFSLSMNDEEFKALSSRLKLFAYKSATTDSFLKIDNYSIELRDPCGNIVIVECSAQLRTRMSKL